jgi:hypothetical protein
MNLFEKIKKSLNYEREGFRSRTGYRIESIESIELEEEASITADQFVSGGTTIVKPSHVDTILAKLFNDKKLSSKMEKSAAYKKGYDSDSNNTFKKNSIDFHLFVLGQQAKAM